MEFLPNGYTLEAPIGCFPFSTDSTVLGHWAKLPKNATVLDLGAGCGTLGLLLCAKAADCRVTGIELSESAHRTALENIARNDLSARLESICADARGLSAFVQPGSFHCVVSNPPYFSGGPASRQNPLARREDDCPPEALFAAAARSLKYGGDFFLVHKPERLAQLCACGAKVGLEAKRLRLVRHKEGGEITLILLSFRKGGKPGLQIDEVTLFTKENTPTDFYRSVYHTE